jgi:hypothetical protein
MPVQLHIVENRIAVLFRDHETMQQILKVVDLEGHELGIYDDLGPAGKRRRDLGVAFACYTLNPERFTFLTNTNEHKLQVQHVEGR